MEIARISEITYNEFVENYLSKNLPCLLDERFTRNWKSRQEWICSGKPCFEFLRKSFGMRIGVIHFIAKFCENHTLFYYFTPYITTHETSK
jgi:hypothetical protein